MSILSQSKTIKPRTRKTLSTKLTNAQIIDWVHTAIALINHEITVYQITKSQKLTYTQVYYRPTSSFFHALSKDLIKISFIKR